MASFQILSFKRLVVSSKCNHTPRSVYSVIFIHTHGRSTNSNQHRHKLSNADCFSLLDIDPECTEEQLRNAYMEKVKAYHPDRMTATSDASKFSEIQNAYKKALDHKRGQMLLEEERKKVDINNIKHTVPQHRRYLTYDGIGFGSPSKRQKQYNQFRVAQATESVFEHQKMKHGTTESAVVTKDKTEARKIKISNLIDRVADDLIRESMQRGDFNNLAGSGKPLDHSDYNPFIDLTTHNINKIMVNNGFKPEWIILSKEIRDGITLAREKLAIVREKLGPPYSEQDEINWNFHTSKFQEQVQAINLKINKYNLIVPFMEKQMVQYNAECIIKAIMNNHEKYLPIDANGKSLDVTQLGPLPVPKAEVMKVKWGEVWFNIKQVFTFR